MQRTEAVLGLGGSRGRPPSGDLLLSAGLLLALLASMAVLLVLLTDMVATGWGVLADRAWAFLSSALSPDPGLTGLRQGIFGSLVLVGFVVVLTFPLGVASAIYLEEYAPDNRLSRMINANIRNLAGVPSIVYGLLGLAVFVKFAGAGRTLVAGGATLAILVLPIMIITASEALRAVPRELREASFGVGATRWQTVRHQVMPVAAPAILTGTVLTVARAFGESAPLLLAGAVLSNFFAPPANTSLWQLVSSSDYTALPIIVFNWSRQPQQEFVAVTAAAIVVLLVILVLVNGTAIVLRDRFEVGR